MLDSVSVSLSTMMKTLSSSSMTHLTRDRRGRDQRLRRVGIVRPGLSGDHASHSQAAAGRASSRGRRAKADRGEPEGQVADALTAVPGAVPYRAGGCGTEPAGRDARLLAKILSERRA